MHGWGSFSAERTLSGERSCSHHNLYTEIRCRGVGVRLGCAHRVITPHRRGGVEMLKSKLTKIASLLGFWSLEHGEVFVLFSSRGAAIVASDRHGLLEAMQ